ncbi:MAG TPA: sulfatase-like hydrolase/transferase [Verrucomicrobiales bacterium]|nr:sulfatase-like hydrolase/transferase [Verrucomicrobiales bacterium]
MIKSAASSLLFFCLLILPNARAADKPGIVLVMADDMGWGQTGYYDHSLLKTPNLDAMAANGLRFDRFYAGAPNCSPSRATVLTGRTNDRTGVQDHGYPLRLQERTIAQVLREAGYATGHFGKWHLSGLSGPGAPVLKEDERNPGVFGFDTWLSVTNFFDRNPLLSRNGEFEEFKGDSSEIVIDEALKFIRSQAESDHPFFAVVWYGSPHDPFMADAKDTQRLQCDTGAFPKLDDESRDHYGELVAMDRSIGALRAGLRDLGIEKNTLLWFNSDNGGLPKITPETVGGLRGFKGTVYEGGLRVPAILEWPERIPSPRITEIPAGTVDIFPTLAVAAGLDDSVLPHIRDGISLFPLFAGDPDAREKPLGFRHKNRAAWIDGNWKLVTQNIGKVDYELYDLKNDPNETNDLATTEPERLARLVADFTEWNTSVSRSVEGKDYPEGRVTDKVTTRQNWPDLEMYRPWFAEWKDRPEFAKHLKRSAHAPK